MQFRIFVELEYFLFQIIVVAILFWIFFLFALRQSQDDAYCIKTNTGMACVERLPAGLTHTYNSAYTASYSLPYTLSFALQYSPMQHSVREYFTLSQQALPYYFPTHTHSIFAFLYCAFPFDCTA